MIYISDKATTVTCISDRITSQFNGELVSTCQHLSKRRICRPSRVKDLTLVIG